MDCVSINGIVRQPLSDVMVMEFAAKTEKFCADSVSERATMARQLKIDNFHEQLNLLQTIATNNCLVSKRAHEHAVSMYCWWLDGSHILPPQGEKALAAVITAREIRDADSVLEYTIKKALNQLSGIRDKAVTEIQRVVEMLAVA